jgi:pilus assembly protein Flp/PilA
MRTLRRLLVRFLKREDGPTSVEHAVMLFLIVVVCISAVSALGTKANSKFAATGNSLGS